MPGKLYVVGTPIGNLEDITYRAVRILSEVDFICAEDTRVTVKLLNHFDIKKPLLSYHEHSASHVSENIISRLQSGEPALYISSVFHDSAIVTDVLTFQNGRLTNLNSGGKLSYSVETLRNYYLYMEDIDDDGIMEMPSLMEIRPAPNQADAKPQQLVYWYAIDSEGYEIQKAFTFHNVDGGWYLLLKMDALAVERLAVAKESSGYTFYLWDETGTSAVALFSIYSFTGKDREKLATEQNRFPIYSGDNVIFAGKLEVGSGVNGITQENLTESFRLIGTDWKQEG